MSLNSLLSNYPLPLNSAFLFSISLTWKTPSQLSYTIAHFLHLSVGFLICILFGVFACCSLSLSFFSLKYFKLKEKVQEQYKKLFFLNCLNESCWYSWCPITQESFTTNKGILLQHTSKMRMQLILWIHHCHQICRLQASLILSIMSFLSEGFNPRSCISLSCHVTFSLQ